MYTTISEFVQDWTRESGTSLKVERALTDASLQQKSDPEGNPLGKIAWHMVQMIGGMGAAAGLSIEAPARGTEPPSAAAAIADAYETAARSMAEQASTKLKDEQLATEISAFGRSLTLASLLQSLVRHQIHHRAQMTILLRAAGLAVPSIYGPSREESAAIRAKQGR
ncbi:MAG TPA: DinB family protein [Spirochaetia bacterium]|nr:DinB family protein [Spirochaetia bacterium]